MRQIKRVSVTVCIVVLCHCKMSLKSSYLNSVLLPRKKECINKRLVLLRVGIVVSENHLHGIQAMSSGLLYSQRID